MSYQPKWCISSFLSPLKAGKQVGIKINHLSARAELPQLAANVRCQSKEGFQWTSRQRTQKWVLALSINPIPPLGAPASWGKQDTGQGSSVGPQVCSRGTWQSVMSVDPVKDTGAGRANREVCWGLGDSWGNRRTRAFVITRTTGNYFDEVVYLWLI